MRLCVVGIVVATFLTGCGQTSEPANTSGAANGATTAQTSPPVEPVELPPSIRETRTFRCADNTIVYAALFNGDEQINLRATQTGTPTILRGPKGGPFKAEDGTEASLDGNVMQLTRPGAERQRCVSS